jgi:hypothetical protein
MLPDAVELNAVNAVGRSQFTTLNTVELNAVDAVELNVVDTAGHS